MSSRLELDNFVTFTGRIPDSRLLEYLCTADLGLAPDPKSPLNDLSSMNKIVEYMAVGLPIVSFDLKESLATAGDAAVFVPNDDEKQMCEAVMNLLNDAERRARMSKIGRERFCNMLSWEFSRAKLVRAYDRLLGGVHVKADAADEPEVRAGARECPNRSEQTSTCVA